MSIVSRQTSAEFWKARAQEHQFRAIALRREAQTLNNNAMSEDIAERVCIMNAAEAERKAL